jgi:hypothetical protein
MFKIKNIAVSAAFLLAIAISANAFADGCNPGEPCYQKPTAPVQKQAVEQAPVRLDQEPMAEEVVVEEESVVEIMNKANYATIGAGWTALEKDEEVLGQQTYEIRYGLYRFLPRISTEIGIAYHPNVRNRRFGSANAFRLDGNTHAMRYTADVLYHLKDETESECVDPYLAFGAGAVHYDKRLKNGHTDAFVEAGAGAFLNLNETFFVKPDYRVMAVGGDTQVNQRATVALGMRF